MDDWLDNINNPKWHQFSYLLYQFQTILDWWTKGRTDRWSTIMLEAHWGLLMSEKGASNGYRVLLPWSRGVMVACHGLRTKWKKGWIITKRWREGEIRWVCVFYTNKRESLCLLRWVCVFCTRNAIVLMENHMGFAW